MKSVSVESAWVIMPDIGNLTRQLSQSEDGHDHTKQNNAASIPASSTAPNDSAPSPPTAGPIPPPAPSPTALNDLLTDLNRHPLFMTTLDDTDGAGGSNPGLDALRSLAYEGTKAEVAENFRQQGNECAKAARWADAREFYTKALDVLAGKVEGKAEQRKGKDVGKEPTLRERLEGDVGEREVDWLDGARNVNDDENDDGASRVVDLEEEAQKERSIEEACVINRAKCNLELSMYIARKSLASLAGTSYVDISWQRTTRQRPATVFMRFA